MESLLLIAKNCRRLKSNLFQQKLVFPAFLSTSCSYLSKKKKINGYEDVNQEKYASLVRTVTAARASHQTPDKLFEEDNFLYGKVVKSKSEMPVSEPKIPQNWAPLTNPSKVILSVEKSDPRIPIKINLPERNHVTNGKVPSVTRILQQTMPMEQAFYLERWKQKMIMELGEKGFIEYTAGLFSQGKQFHATLEDLLLSLEDSEKRQDSEELSGYLASVQHVLADISGVRSLESAVHHSALHYLGLVDCVAEYRQKLCVIDWKTSEKPKPNLRDTFDNPLQVAAYVGAINHDGNYNFQVDCGLIVVAYKDGSPAHPHFMDPDVCLHYWNKWLLRFEEYKEKKAEK
ncbi:mitochondrial genome maintenance exonuclease 1 [Rhinophrynus dorsalis]